MFRLGKDAYYDLASIHKILPLDYFGVNFTQLDDGRIFVFEANGSMRIPYIELGELDPAPYRKPSIEAIVEALSVLLEDKIEVLKSNTRKGSIPLCTVCFMMSVTGHF